MTRPDLQDATSALARLRQKVDATADWLAAAETAVDPREAMQQAIAGCNAVISEAQAARAAIRPELFRTDNAMRTSVADLDQRDRFGVHP